jgi:hypothetical protein
MKIDTPFARSYNVAEFFFGEEAGKYVDIIDEIVNQILVDKDDIQFGVALQKYLNMEKFQVSTNILNETTAGYGKLDENGFFKYPFPVKFIKQFIYKEA